MSAASVVRNPEFVTIAEKVEGRQTVRLVLVGKMNANGLGDLRREIEDARRLRKQVIVDLTEITLVDRVSVDYLSLVRGPHVRLENCPEYLRRWISGPAV